ncbi:uncharacterized protein LOC130665346 [Microplitis mediator]|uniref:uncharacterized protein LOC130665346 n=1 Tax=Microplitis mediator TaxID=375433 RepID=UPI0025525CA3|nr:uncharacterized protein LOC130665346 [Microplitis mediator]
MFTLDKISTQLSYTEKTQCVFEELGRCSINREFGIVCREHAKQIFGIALISAVVVLPTGESRHHAVVSTEPRNIFLPFPYEFTFNTDRKINHEVKPCLKRDVLRDEISHYVQQMEVNSPALSYNIESALVSLLTDGLMFNQALRQASYNFQVFCNPNIRMYLEKRWENCFVTVKLTDNGTRFVEYPIKMLPLFYQIMFMYLTLSNNQLDPKTNPQAANTYHQLQPKIILHATRYRFEYCNHQEPSKLCLLRGNANYATPLVLAGRQVHKYNVELFKQGAYYNYSLNDDFEFCAPSVNN